MNQLLRTVILNISFGIATFAADSFVGVWKFNPAESKLMRGQKVDPHTLTCETAQDGYSFKNSIQDAAAVFHLNGEKYPTTPAGGFAARLGADEYSATRLSPTAILSTNYRNKKEVGTIRREISADGKTMTSTSDGTTVAGQKVHFVLIYNKQ